MQLAFIGKLKGKMHSRNKSIWGRDVCTQNRFVLPPCHSNPYSVSCSHSKPRNLFVLLPHHCNHSTKDVTSQSNNLCFSVGPQTASYSLQQQKAAKLFFSNLFLKVLQQLWRPHLVVPAIRAEECYRHSCICQDTLWVQGGKFHSRFRIWLWPQAFVIWELLKDS